MLSSAFEGNLTAWQVTAKDKKHVVLLLVRELITANPSQLRIRLQGLKEDALYTDLQTGKKYYGDELMYKGYFPEVTLSDFASLLVEFVEV